MASKQRNTVTLQWRIVTDMDQKITGLCMIGKVVHKKMLSEFRNKRGAEVENPSVGNRIYESIDKARRDLQIVEFMCQKTTVCTYGQKYVQNIQHYFECFQFLGSMVLANILILLIYV